MFYRHLRPSTCGHVHGTWFSLEDKRGLSLGELIRPFCIMLSCWYLLLFGLLYYLWYHIYAFSLLFCKDYLKRENSGSWNSGLEKEQILVHYSAHLQMPWKVTCIFLVLYKKYSVKELPEGGCQGATSPDTATPWWQSGGLWAPWRPTAPLFFYMKGFVREKSIGSFFLVSPLPRGGTWANPI